WMGWGGGATAKEVVAGRAEMVGQVLVALGEVGLARHELGKARGLLEGPRHLDLFPVHRAVLPVGGWRPLVQDVAGQLALLEDVRARARRPLFVPHLSFGLPLLLADDHDV